MGKLAYTIPDGKGNPAWSSADKTTIDMDVFFPHLEETVRFTAAKADPGWEHSEEIFARAQAGDFGEIAEYIAAPEPVPPDVSRAQFARGMRKKGLFSQAEALAFVSGASIPSTMQAIINRLESDEAREDAALLVLGAARIERDHPMTKLVAAGVGWSTAETDEFFREVARL